MKILIFLGRSLSTMLPVLALAGCWGTSSSSSDSGTSATALTLQLTPGNAQVSLNWTSEPGTGYHVMRAVTSGGTFTEVAAPTVTAYTDVGLVNGTTYYYVVSALQGATTIATSSQKSATPTSTAATTGGTAPTVPTGLAATAGNASVSLTWNAVASATRYSLERAVVSGGPYVLVSQPSTSAYSDLALVNGATYYYIVAAIGPGGSSTYSAPVSVTLGTTSPAPTPQAPASPTGLLAVAGVSQVSLVWAGNSAATSYTLQRATVSGGPYTQISTTTSTAFTDISLAAGTYFYVVSASNAVGTSANSSETSASPVSPDVTVALTLNTSHAISPYIYGVNGYASITNGYAGFAGAPAGIKLDRAGGNRWTTYNWQNNASNSGSNANYTNDNYLSASATPAEAVRAVIAADQTNNMATLMTFQLQGLVSADENGAVNMSNPPQSDASSFKTVVAAKGAAFTATPSTSNANVYMDEFAWAVDQKFSGQGVFTGTPLTQPVFAELDDEPELWNNVHLEVQGPTIISPAGYIQHAITLAESLKTQFPGITIFGPVHYGFGGMYSWQGSLNPTPNGNNWFPDLYLPAIASAAASFGSRVIDVYDFHWYSEATDPNGNRVTGLSGAALTDDQIEAIVQSPRSLWDNTYTENSWITSQYTLNGPIYILGRLQSRIASEAPGTKIAITDYFNGGAQNIAGTLAQADNLGIFGAQALFAANLAVSGEDSYILAGFRAFADFDGANSNFGDTSVLAASSNVQNIAAYASSDSAHPGRVVLVLINRSFASQVVLTTGLASGGTGHLYQITAQSSQNQSTIQPSPAGTVPVSVNSLAVTLPPLSVTTVDVH